MAKRFTDKSKYRDPWYRKLPVAYKALWEYINDECDSSGMWLMDFETAAYFLGEQVNALDAKKHFADRIATAGSKWFLKGYVLDQYGKLHGTSKIHLSIISRLKSHGIDIDDNGLPIFISGDSIKFDGMAIPSQWDKNKEEVKEEVKDNNTPDEKIIPLTPVEDPYSFEKFWNLYDKKQEKDECEKIYAKISRTDRQKIFEHIPLYKQAQPDKQFRKYPRRYLSRKSWNDEITNTNEQPNTTSLTANLGRPTYGGAKSL